MAIVAGLTEMAIYAIIMIIGACMAVVIPYLLNKWKDKATEVNWAYVAILLFSCIIAVFLGLPDKVDTIDMNTIKIALLSGYGLQAIIGKIAKTILEPKEDPTI
jgi:hypothetical protein